MRTSKTTPNERAYATRVVRELGTLVGRLRAEADDFDLSEDEARRVMLLAFQILGEKSGMSYQALIQRLRHQK